MSQVPVPAHDLLFYDGGCGLCHHLVRFVIRRDLDGSRFRFAPLGGPAFLGAILPGDRDRLPDSVVLRTADGRTLVRSDAVLHLGERLGGVWRFLARAAGLLPRWLLDFGYDRVAAVRKRLFPPPDGVCPVLPPELRGRFLE